MNISDCVIDRVWTLVIGVLMLRETPTLIPWLIPLAVCGLILNVYDGARRAVQS